MNGKGVFNWPSGAVYQGEYLKGIKHGYGKMMWSTGKVYEGQWIRGM